ncbi:MAG TPA: hypothetical protein PKD09_10570 [Aggregatilinea sp.]|uniref:hypothetical protein n=1 Tax=Aggregatilinea sp. TaxID=2806333 RepID=UPI002B5EA5FE|nr:hypothetical protein [Aggregatilinea sp.]HML22086.1 hypothetical protein [Aggregatilinea sp.]
MPAYSTGDLNLVRSHPQRVKRYVSVAPRAVLFQTQVESVTTDADTGGVVALTWTGTLAGSWEAVTPDLTLDVGTTAGAHDVGQLRVRKAATATTLYVAEESPGHMAVAAGHYLTVRDEYRIWTRLNLLREISTGGLLQAFTEYKDYDVAYSSGYAALPPLANIDLKPAGFVDAGQTYRTVQLSASRSAAVYPNATLVGYLWDIADGTLVAGTLGDATITVRFPATTTFRHISLQVTDSNGASSVAYRGVWVHDADHPPQTVLRVDRDSRVLGREMQFTFFGRTTDASETVIPEGATICYWELAVFGPAASAPPSGYIDQFVGWIMHDIVLHAPRSTYTISVSGPHYWLDQITGPQYRLNRNVTPTVWTDLPLLSPDMIVYTLLRWHTTALNVCSLFLSGVTNEWLMPSIAKASIWQQMTNELNGYMGRARCDSLGAIWLRQRANFLTTDERTARGVTCTLGAESWRAEEGVSIATDYNEPVGLVVANGFAYEVGMKSYAPGDTPGPGSTVEMPAQALALWYPQAYLNRIAGDYLADANNPRPDETIRLLGNLDIVEPAWDEFVQFDLPAEGNLRGQDLSSHRWTVDRVEVSHVGDQKQIRWSLVQETQGIPGKTVPIDENAVTPLVPDDFNPAQSGTSEQPELAPELLPDGEQFSLVTSGGLLVTCTGWRSEPTWGLGLDLAAAGADGDVLSACADAFSPGWNPDVGGAINAKIATVGGIADVDDLYGSPALTTRHTFAADTDRRIIHTERGVDGFWAVVSVHDDGVRLAAATDGTTWAEHLVSSVMIAGTAGVGALIETLNVDSRSASGATSTTSLTAGTTYLIRITGSWIYSSTITLTRRRDAIYDRTDLSMANWVRANNVAIDGSPRTPIDDTPNTEHVYEFLYTAPGGTVNVKHIDSVYSDNSGTFVAEIYEYTVGLPSGSLPTPTLAVSGKRAGRLILGAYISSGGLPVGELFESTDYGASTSQVDTPATDFGLALGGHLHVPWDGDDLLSYWCKVLVDANAARRTELGGLAISDLGAGGGPVGDKAFDSNPNNRQHVAMSNVRADGYRRIEVSRYGGASGTWQPLTDWLAPEVCYSGVAISGSDTLYMFGPAGIAVAPNLGPDVIDKTSNLFTDFPGAGAVIALIGGPVFSG